MNVANLLNIDHMGFTKDVHHIIRATRNGFQQLLEGGLRVVAGEEGREEQPAEIRTDHVRSNMAKRNHHRVVSPNHNAFVVSPVHAQELSWTTPARRRFVIRFAPNVHHGVVF